MVSPHAPGIRRASCPHTPWKELLDLQPVLKPHAKAQDSNNSFRSTREGWWFHAPSIISCSFRWISFKTAAKIQIIPQWGMNSFEKFPQWGMNLIIFIPHWGIFTHIMAKFAWNDHRKTQQITPEICQFAFAQAENLTNKWENMQKSWRKTQNRCKRKRKKWRNEGICHPKTGDAGPKTGDAGLKTGDLGTPKKGASPVDALR